jgi:cysteine sulfinate desulfinase/cysteine desulfurase-like protein
MKDLIYLDNNATTPLDQRVIDAMLPYYTEYYGNAASIHYLGKTINKAIVESRNKIAHLINKIQCDQYTSSCVPISIKTADCGFSSVK